MCNVSFVIPCCGRLATLQRTLKSYLTAPVPCEVIVVDYNCPQDTGSWLRANFAEVQVVKVRDGSALNIPLARNIGARAATRGWICFADVDVSPRPEFYNFLSGDLRVGSYYTCDLQDQFKSQSLYGTCVVAREDWARSPYDENMEGWGAEDIEFYSTLQSFGLSSMRFDPGWLYHLPHSDTDRIKLRGNRDQAETYFINLVYHNMRKDIAAVTRQPVSANVRALLYAQLKNTLSDALKAGSPTSEILVDLGQVVALKDFTASRTLLYKVAMPQ